MKTYTWIVCMLAFIGIAGCIGDNGNYDYLPESEVMPAVISGLEDEYTFEFGSIKKLEATVEHVEGREHLRYMWYIYQTSGNERDTLGNGKTLDFYVNYPTGTYDLWFEVRDTLADVCVNKKMKVDVTTFLTTAWLVMETDGAGTDVDAIDINGKLRENLLTSNGYTRMEGMPRRMHYVRNYTVEVRNTDGTVTQEKKKAFLFFSERSIRILNAENLAVFNEDESCFYALNGAIAPQSAHGDRDIPFINDGKFYYLSGVSANIGKFGYCKFAPDGTENYEVDGTFLMGSQCALVWDKMSRSFWYSGIFDDMLAEFNPPTDEDFGVTSEMGQELKCLLPKPVSSGSYHKEGYAVLEKDGEFTIKGITFNKQAYPFSASYRVPAEAKIGTSEVLCAHKVNPKIFFAHNGSELWEHTPSSADDIAKRERKLLSFPGETIACLRHVNIKNSMDCLVVLTNDAKGWKLYKFPFIGGGSEFDTAVNPEDVLIGKGEGKGGYFMRVDTYAY